MSGERFPRGAAEGTPGTGSTTAARYVPDGEYKPRVHLVGGAQDDPAAEPDPRGYEDAEGRRGRFARVVAAFSVSLRTATGTHNTIIAASATCSTARAHALFYVDGRQVLAGALPARRRADRGAGAASSPPGRPLPAGVYKGCKLAAKDLAGNVGARTAPQTVDGALHRNCRRTAIKSSGRCTASTSPCAPTRRRSAGASPAARARDARESRSWARRSGPGATASWSRAAGTPPARSSSWGSGENPAPAGRAARAAVGLALLLLSRRRDLRLAGLAAWVARRLALAVVSRSARAPAAARRRRRLRARSPRRGRGGSSAAGRGSSPSPRSPARPRGSRSRRRHRGEPAGPALRRRRRAAVLLAWELLRGDVRGASSGRSRGRSRARRLVRLSLALDGDVRQGSIELVFFVLPFGLLAVVSRPAARGGGAGSPRSTSSSRRWRSSSRRSASSSGRTRDVFWNPKVIVGNAYAPFFRVNSVFWDPSIYGRFLVVAILATLVPVALGARRARRSRAALAFVLARPALVVLAVELRRAGRRDASSRRSPGAGGRPSRRRRGGLIALVALAPRRRHAPAQVGRRLNNATSGRWGQVTNGLHIAVAPPARRRRARRFQARLRRAPGCVGRSRRRPRRTTRR